MFNIFKKNKPLHQLPISEAIIKLRKKGVENLHINIYSDDIILFQVSPARHFEKQGLKSKIDDMVIIHTFSKTKNNLKTLNDLKEKETDLFYFEGPKGVHHSLDNIGHDPYIMEKKINQLLKLHQSKTTSKLIIEYLEP